MKKIILFLFGAGILVLLYYFFIKQSEFEANFKANTLPGDLIQTIRIWTRSLDHAEVIEVDSFSTLKQNITRNERNYVYVWRFETLNDSVTKVNIQISESGRHFLNKLLVPFTNQPIEKDASELVKEFYDVLKGHLKITDVKLTGEASLDSTFCACTALETRQIDKARGMMKDFSLLTSFTDEFKLKLNGPPSVRIHQWNHSAGLIKFDFCFPIVQTDSLPRVAEIFYKKFERQTVLKAEYHGNYITSDRAWYALIHDAKKNGFDVNGLPIEYFYDNPTLGINEKEWKAEVFLPIKGK